MRTPACEPGRSSRPAARQTARAAWSVELAAKRPASFAHTSSCAAGPAPASLAASVGRRQLLNAVSAHEMRVGAKPQSQQINLIEECERSFGTPHASSGIVRRRESSREDPLEHRVVSLVGVACARPVHDQVGDADGGVFADGVFELVDGAQAARQRGAGHDQS
jgi:hypothetical protein